MNVINKLSLMFLISILIISCADTPIKTSIEQNQSKSIYSKPSRDPGYYQSPINILSFDTQQIKEPHLFNTKFEDKVIAVENLGHTVQMDFKSGSTINVDDVNYTFKQMHFHTPSEHLIDGVTYPMELHIVAVNNDKPNLSRYVVFGVLFKMGEKNKFIDEFLNKIPKHEHDKTEVKKNTIKLKDLISKSDVASYYHYSGSLTTPPYTETVNWFVLKKIFQAEPEQIERINAIEGNNARHIELNNNRLVEEN